MSVPHPMGEEISELATILDSLAEGLFVVDRQCIIRRWNRAMTEMSGYSAQEAIGQSCFMLKCETCEEYTFSPDECPIFKSGEVRDIETCIRRKDGLAVPVTKSTRMLRDSSGSVVGAVETLNCLSEVRQLEMEVSRLRGEIQERFQFDNIVGKSAPMQEVFNLIELAAASNATVLIQGETGTGKELVAKAIHYHGDRRDASMVSVNCSALSESLLESELFGHVEGAFTGAVRDHVGRFERAHGGTIFLDEVSEIPASVQVKLLRVLQEREYERVGESEPRKVDVRVIAATSKDLRDMAERDRFREDLFYRLKVFPIQLPPLRERKDDLQPLVSHFITRFNASTGKAIAGLTPDAMRIVMDYCWRGNVRELENAIEHAFVTCATNDIGPFDLPVEIRRVELRQSICERLNSAPPLPTPSLARSKPSPATREQLLTLLDECGWNKAEVGRRLGITRTTVWRRMKTFGIPLKAD